MAKFARSSASIGSGIGYRAPHFPAIVASRPAVGFFEVHAENYMTGGEALDQLEALRRDWPISLHGVGLSLGSAEGVDAAHLGRLVNLVDRVQPLLVSEHLAWSRAGTTYLNDLLPLPYTEESLAIVAANVSRLQDALRRPVLIENPSAYLRFRRSTIAEGEFLAALARSTGCGVLCDVNNIFVSCRNVGGDPFAFLAALPAEHVGELHLAGHAVNDADGTPILIDDHGSPVAPPVWDLYAAAIARFPDPPTLIEWDVDLPSLDILVGEAATADRLRRQVLGELRHADAA